MALNLIKKDICMTKTKGNSLIQLTLNDDFNVPDIKPDIDKIIQEQSDIIINHIDTMNDKVKVNGDLKFTILYLTESDQKPVHSMTGSIPFEEIINLDEIMDDDIVKLICDIEDNKASLINSRKLNVKCIITIKALAEENYNMDVAVNVDGIEDLQSVEQPIMVCQVFANKKDTYRVRDEIALPNSKPNIMEILWTDANIRNSDIRLLDDKINVKGEINLFVLYMGETDEKPVEFAEFEIPFNGVLECDGCIEEMIANVTMGILSKDIEIRPDLDGEERLLDVEIITELNIKIYNQEEINILKDIYTPSREVIINRKPITYENILMKNQTQCKVSEKVEVHKNEPKILQICHTDGQVKIDDIEKTDQGLTVEGVIFTQIMYVAADDKMPMNVIKEIIPFSHMIDIKGMNENCQYDVVPSLDYISCNMLDDQEVEVRCGVNMNTIVFDQIQKDVITEIEEEDIDIKKIQKLPSIVGYIVKKDDTLWDIAKRFYTTIDSVRTINEITDDEEISAGDKLIIIKNVENLIS